MKGALKAHLILTLTALIGGFNFSIAKIVMPDFVQPSAIIIIRGVSSILFFWLIHFIFIREKISHKRDFVQLLLCAFFGITANQLLFYEGLNLTTPINAALLQCGVPIFVMLFSAVKLKERLTLVKIAGLILGASGAVFLLIHSGRGTVTGTHWGDLMVLLNALSYGYFLVLVQPLTSKYDPFTVVKWVFLFGTIMSVPFGWNQLMQVNWQEMPDYAWMSLAYIVIFSTIVNYYLNIGVLRYVHTSIAGIYIYLQPVFTSIIAVAWGKDEITLGKCMYSLLIFAGVYMVSKKTNSESKEQKAESEKLNAKGEELKA